MQFLLRFLQYTKTQSVKLLTKQLHIFKKSKIRSGFRLPRLTNLAVFNRLQKGSKIDLLSKCGFFLKMRKKYFFSTNQKKILQLQKWDKTYLAVLLGYETIIWHHQSQNLGFCYVLMPAHCAFNSTSVINHPKVARYYYESQEEGVVSNNA